MGRSDSAKRLSIPCSRYLLWVVACDVGELVGSAGGFLCDRVQAGWDVNVALTDTTELRPLHILGLTTVASPPIFEPNSDPGEFASIAFTPRAFYQHSDLRREVLRALRNGWAEVTVCGSPIPGELDGHVHELRYRLSSAARAFKTHAVGAVSVASGPVAGTENLYSSAVPGEQYE